MSGSTQPFQGRKTGSTPVPRSEMKTIRDEIFDFVPSCEQESVDKQLILSYLDSFNDIFSRENNLSHMTTSAFVLNKERNKILMIFHNIYNSWGWIGGHADGDIDLFSVIKREIEEETGVKGIVPVVNKIFSLEVLPVASHFRRGKYVSAHTHISIDYIFEADERENIRIKEDENSNIAWVPIEKVVSLSTEPYMKIVYQKMIDKISKLR